MKVKIEFECTESSGDVRRIFLEENFGDHNSHRIGVMIADCMENMVARPMLVLAEAIMDLDENVFHCEEAIVREAVELIDKWKAWDDSIKKAGETDGTTPNLDS